MTLIATGLTVPASLEAAAEHFITGGLGSAVAEVLSEKLPTRMARIGIRDRFGESGPASELIHKFGLDAEGICGSVRRAFD